MKKLLNKLFGYGCLCCGMTVSSKSDILCPRCSYRIKHRQPHDPSPIISAVSYQTEQAKALITYMKAYHDPHVFDYAASLIQEKLLTVDHISQISDHYITYAPRNPVTFLKMRFDQSKEIADFLALRLFEDDTGRVISLFGRHPFAGEQKKLGVRGRADNVRDLFHIRRNVRIPEKLIIVDDVTTTGATLLTLSKLAYEAGVRECILCSVASNDIRAGY